MRDDEHERGKPVESGRRSPVPHYTVLISKQMFRLKIAAGDGGAEGADWPVTVGWLGSPTSFVGHAGLGSPASFRLVGSLAILLLMKSLCDCILECGYLLIWLYRARHPRRGGACVLFRRSL